MARICAAARARKIAAKRMVLTRYPNLKVMETASPPVSPRVVAAILITQKVRVTSGTLVAVTGMSRAVSQPVGGRAGRSARLTILVDIIQWIVPPDYIH